MLPDDVAHQLSRAMLCLAVSTSFGRPDPSRRQRAAFRAATPALPDAAVLGEARARARREIDGIAASAAGKALLVDYYGSMMDPGRDHSQAMVDRMSGFLQENCLTPG